MIMLTKYLLLMKKSKPPYTLVQLDDTAICTEYPIRCIVKPICQTKNVLTKENNS
ncbi:hypothetical protein WN51_00017 [Melipona quadrifasciata]|uniref:Uncharacterized protein n=1 Tax=Melipona quadrifasciata TaxID=166423 RepID=A0A0M8ZPZ8_9HYME|nr:hypothetical protein WN51_00017 [Melipona quadrifasciata]